MDLERLGEKRGVAFLRVSYFTGATALGCPTLTVVFFFSILERTLLVILKLIVACLFFGDIDLFLF